MGALTTMHGLMPMAEDVTPIGFIPIQTPTSISTSVDYPFSFAIVSVLAYSSDITTILTSIPRCVRHKQVVVLALLRCKGNTPRPTSTPLRTILHGAQKEVHELHPQPTTPLLGYR